MLGLSILLSRRPDFKRKVCFMAEEKKVKRPSALKRDAQSARRNLKNRAYKAKVSTATRSLQEVVKQKNASLIPEKLNTVFSLMDKGVKTGVFKLNKASRVKSKLAQWVNTSAV